MKSLLLPLLAAMLFISACSDSDSGNSSTRTVSGTLSGDLSNVSAVVATTSSGGGAVGADTLPALFMGALQTRAATAPAEWGMEVPVGEGVSIKLVDEAGSSLAVMEWATSANGGQTTTVINITPGVAIDLGVSGVPQGLDASVLTLISSTNNPLMFLDNDGDGTSDYDDADDDNDGVEDEQDSDDDGDGVEDEEEESDTDGDGTPDTEDEDSEDADNDDDGIEDETDPDDDNDGEDDETDPDDDGDGIPDEEEEEGEKDDDKDDEV